MKHSHILIVDDDTDFLSFVADVIEGIGFEHIVTTENPSEFERLYSRHIDVVVLDLFMPEIDGIELLRYLAKQRIKASIIFMSGKDKGVLQSAQKLAVENKLNVLGTLQKPFYAADLESLMAKYISLADNVIPGTLDTDKQFVPAAQDIQAASQNSEFYLVFQPQISLQSGELVGVETLIRWQHPVHGSVSPALFIPIAENLGLIEEISQFVNEAAIKQHGEWLKQGRNIRLSLNLSPKMLADLDLPEKLDSLASQAGSLPSKIMLEVTETALMEDVVRFMDILTRLRMKNFNLSIDDFGTGYSSMLQLV